MSNTHEDEAGIAEFSEGDECLFFEKYCLPELKSVESKWMRSRKVAQSKPAEELSFFERVFAFGRVKGEER